MESSLNEIESAVSVIDSSDYQLSALSVFFEVLEASEGSACIAERLYSQKLIELIQLAESLFLLEYAPDRVIDTDRMMITFMNIGRVALRLSQIEVFLSMAMCFHSRWDCERFILCIYLLHEDLLPHKEALGLLRDVARKQLSGFKELVATDFENLYLISFQDVCDGVQEFIDSVS